MGYTSEGHQPLKKYFWTKDTSAKPALSIDDITIVDKSMLKRAVGAAALGNAMEWFDFGVYSFLAVTIGKVFSLEEARLHNSWQRLVHLRLRFW